MLRETKTHMSNYTHAQTHTSDYCCVWTLPLKTACSAAFTHCGPLIHSFPLFSVSCWLWLSFPRQGQFPAGCRPAFVLSVSLSSLTWIFCKTETSCLSEPLKHLYFFFVMSQINIMPMCTSHDTPAKKGFLGPSALKPSGRESPHSGGMLLCTSMIGADVWNPACHHAGLCCACLPDAPGLHGCSVIVLLVQSCPEINTATRVWAFAMSPLRLESEHSTL